MTATEREALRFAATWITTRWPERKDVTDAELNRALVARWMAQQMRREADAEAPA